MVLIYTILIGIAWDFAGAMPADSSVQYYASKYDHIDVEAILNNRRMVSYYSACLLSQGPCPPEGVEFKRILPEALQTNCERCTEKQVTVALRAIRRVKKEYPKIWSQLVDKWDPDESHVNKFESTFGSKPVPVKPLKNEQALTLNIFADESDELNNNIDGRFIVSKSISHQNPTTHKVITTTNSIPPSFTISISTTTDPSYEPTSLVSTPKTTTKTTLLMSSSFLASHSTTTRPSTATTSSKTTSSPNTTDSTISTTSTKTSTRLPIIPGFVPINTFFTNPPIPVRPIINLNIGANIGATVKAIKQVERVLVGVALGKLAFIKNMFQIPLRKTRRKYS